MGLIVSRIVHVQAANASTSKAFAQSHVFSLEKSVQCF